MFQQGSFLRSDYLCGLIVKKMYLAHTAGAVTENRPEVLKNIRFAVWVDGDTGRYRVYQMDMLGIT